MSAVSIWQLWSRAWDLFKVNWLLLVGLLILLIIVSLIPLIGTLIAVILLFPALVRAGYLVARQGQSSFEEAIRDLSLLLKVFVYHLILWLIPGILIGMGVYGVLESVAEMLAAPPLEAKKGYGAMIVSMMLSGTGGVLIGAGLVLLFISYLFGWAGPYAILSGRAGVFSAISQSFSLTAQNFGKVFLALLSYIGFLIFVNISGQVVSLQWFYTVWTLMWYLIVGPMAFVFLPLLYLALTGEEGASHA